MHQAISLDLLKYWFCYSILKWGLGDIWGWRWKINVIKANIIVVVVVVTLIYSFHRLLICHAWFFAIPNIKSQGLKNKYVVGGSSNIQMLHSLNSSSAKPFMIIYSNVLMNNWCGSATQLLLFDVSVQSGIKQYYCLFVLPLNHADCHIFFILRLVCFSLVTFPMVSLILHSLIIQAYIPSKHLQEFHRDLLRPLKCSIRVLQAKRAYTE